MTEEGTTRLCVTLPELHPRQKQIVREAKRFNVLECGRRFGKTQLAIQLVLETAIDRKPAAWFAPTYKTLAEQWREAEIAFGEIITGKNKDTQQMRFLGGGLLDFWSLDNPDSGRGRKYARVVIDEAAMVQELKQAWEQTIRATLADMRGDAWFLSTPKPEGGMGDYFHALYEKGEKGQPDWKSWRFTTLDNPYIPPEEIAEAERDLPDDVYRQEFLGIRMGSGLNVFFRPEILRAVKERHCRPPASTGELLFDVDTLAEGTAYTMTEPIYSEGHTKCRLKIWEHPKADRNYVSFADISCGVGSSNSSIEVACVDTRETVATMTTSDLLPDQFARYGVALSRFYAGQCGYCLHGWEVNGGQGEVYGREVSRLGYIYVLGNRDLRKWRELKNDKIGWWSTRDAKAVLLSDLRRALALGEYIPRESEMIDEAMGYIYLPSGAIGPANLTEDSTGAQKAHGDRVIAAGGIILMFRNAGGAHETPKPETPRDRKIREMNQAKRIGWGGR